MERENDGTDQKPYLLTQIYIQNWVKNIVGKHIQGIDNKVISRIYGHGKSLDDEVKVNFGKFGYLLADVTVITGKK